MQRRSNFWYKFNELMVPQVVLFGYTLIALFPIALTIMNSLKTRKAIFKAPWLPPLADTFSLEGYYTVFARSSFQYYFLNSLIITIVALILIVFTGAMAAYALSEYDFPGNTFLGLYLALGIMIPIRLGTVSILRLVVAMILIDTLTALILVYTAQGLPLTIFVLQQFMRQVPRELKEAARIDGASEYRIFGMILPLVRPAIATVAVFVTIPIWNALWFPLILAPGERTKTVTYGAQQFLGQFVSDWNAVLASLTLAMIPILLLYILFSRQLIRGITAGAVK
jgi:raffinose/stachyose/melibiose transport system permease protein